MRAPLLLPLATALVLAGCGVTNGGVRFDNPPEQSRDPGGPSQPSPAEVAIASLFGDALAELRLTEAQRTQSQHILDALIEKHRPALLARKVLSVDLARSVEAIKVDGDLLMLDAKNLGDARAASAADDLRALTELHDLLDPTQRAAFAAVLTARADKLKVDDSAARTAAWRYDLHWGDAQDARIREAVAKNAEGDAKAVVERDAWAARLRATAEAFRGEKFTSDAFIDKDVVATTVARTARLVAFLRAVLPLLDDPQRARAATIIRSDVGLPPRGPDEPTK